MPSLLWLAVIVSAGPPAPASISPASASTPYEISFYGEEQAAPPSPPPTMPGSTISTPATQPSIASPSAAVLSAPAAAPSPKSILQTAQNTLNTLLSSVGSYIPHISAETQSTVADSLFFEEQMTQMKKTVTTATELHRAPGDRVALEDRDNFGSFLDGLGISGAAVELGAADGDFSSRLMSQWAGCRHMILVDLWTQPGSHSFVKKLVEPLGEKVSLVQDESRDVAEMLPDRSLVFVYVDASHQYEDVKQDMESFWPKLAHGAVMAGHDYSSLSVIQAVDEFVAAHNLTLHLTNPMTPRKYITGAFDVPACCPTWYVFKDQPAPASFGKKEGAMKRLSNAAESGGTGSVDEHAFFLQASKAWLTDPVVWGHEKLQMTFPAWKKIADITFLYPEGVDPKATVNLQAGSENYTRGTPLWPFVEKNTKQVTDRAPIIWMRSELCNILKAGHYSKPHVMISLLGDNWGTLATQIPDRTTQWGDLEKTLRQCGQSLASVKEYLDDPRLLMFVVTQHQHAQIANHPKVLPIPLGVAAPEHADLIVPLVSALIHGGYYKKLRRKRLFYINNSGWKHRSKINALLNKAFPGAWDESKKKYGHIQREETECCGNINQFCNHAQPPNEKPMPFGCQKYLPYLEDMLQSKFVLCPSGMGYDSYRHMEVLYMGAIPVFEKYAGFNMTYHDLPILMVDSYETLTPAFLEAEYPKILARYNEYDWERLSFHWYAKTVMEAAKSVR